MSFQILESTVYHHHYLKVICLQNYFPQKNQLKEFQIIIHSKELVIQRYFDIDKFPIGEDSSWITGQNISIDGGLSTLKI